MSVNKFFFLFEQNRNLEKMIFFLLFIAFLDLIYRYRTSNMYVIVTFSYRKTLWFLYLFDFPLLHPFQSRKFNILTFHKWCHFIKNWLICFWTSSLTIRIKSIIEFYTNTLLKVTLRREFLTLGNIQNCFPFFVLNFLVLSRSRTLRFNEIQYS